MLSISHAAAGAAIASVIPNPGIAIPLILASHYLLDAVPHWDAGTGLSSGQKTVRAAIIHEIPDLFLAVIVVLVIFPISPMAEYTLSNFLLSSQFLGLFFGLLPDFLEAPRNFLNYEPKFLTALNNFHHRFHHSIPRIADGLAPQIVLLIFLWLIR